MLPAMSNDAPAARSARAIAASVADGSTTARAEIEAALERAEALQESTNAFTHILHERARIKSDALDGRVAQLRSVGEPVPPLAGVPIVVKANLCVAGAPTTAASKILETFVPPYDATVIARLEAAGAIVIAMANQDEFGMGGSSEASAYGPVRNPVDASRVAGGSSGGSAAAVAGGVVPIALGTDTGGSVRQPAAFCGVLGFKPTYGTFSRYGVMAYGSSLDQIGVVTHGAEDLALVLDAAVGRDPHDATSLAVEPSFMSGLGAANAGRDQSLAGLRVGVVPELVGEGNQQAVLDALQATKDRLEALGASVVDASIPSARAALAAYYLIATAEASSNLARYDGMITGVRVGEDGDGQSDVMTQSRGQGFGLEVKRRILMGSFALSAGHVDAWYGRALQVRRKVADEMAAAFGQVDLLLTPTAPTTAFPLGKKVNDPLAMYLGDVDTVLANLAGNGGISVPAGTDEDGLPIGMQFLAPPLEDGRLLRVAAALQQSA